MKALHKPIKIPSLKAQLSNGNTRRQTKSFKKWGINLNFPGPIHHFEGRKVGPP